MQLDFSIFQYFGICKWLHFQIRYKKSVNKYFYATQAVSHPKIYWRCEKKLSQLHWEFEFSFKRPNCLSFAKYIIQFEML